MMVKKAVRSIVLILVLANSGCEQKTATTTSQTQVCNSNLDRIEDAKIRWYVENNKTLRDVPTTNDLEQYIGKMPSCPNGGTYTIGQVSVPVACSVKGHHITEPKDR